MENWHAVLGDPTLADAILDRLVHTPIASISAANRCANTKRV
ncbi:ATP-binding protein [Paraburkholderia kururiensis]